MRNNTRSLLFLSLLLILTALLAWKASGFYHYNQFQRDIWSPPSTQADAAQPGDTPPKDEAQDDAQENSATGQKALLKIQQLRQIIHANYYRPVKDEDLLVGMEKGLFEGLNDPYSQYYTPKEYKALMETTSGSFVGIGIQVSPTDDGLITVIAPIEGSPAFAAGIAPGDKILEVNGTKYDAKTLDQAIAIIKGKENEAVSLKILRKDKEPFDVSVIRKRIVMQSVKSQMKNQVAVMRISSFDEQTGEEFAKQWKELQAQNPKGLIIDVRDNPGGLLTQVQKVADTILGKATIAYMENREGEREYLKSGAGGELRVPLVLLINANSASASEILAGAVRDNKAGQLVGETTFGKGLVQNTGELPDGSGYKITIAQYYTPSGEYIHEKGIAPDFPVKDPETQMQKALELILSKKP